MDTVIALSNLNGWVSALSEEERKIFTSVFVLKESVHSSSIEGTRSTISDMYRYEKEVPDESRNRDAVEVRNYLSALNEGMDALKRGGKIDIPLLHRLHKILLTGTRGGNKSPGEFKTEPNAIGKPGDTLDTAKIVPAVPEEINHLMDNLLEYIDSDDDPLVKIALAHYQFEAIHPYRDGNGRIGRLLIMLILFREGLLEHPAIYPSGYFDAHREEYIDGLFKVSSEDAFDEWFMFFMGALKVQAETSIEMMRDLRGYRRFLEDRYVEMNLHRIIGMLFENPYLRIADVAERCGVTQVTAAKQIKILESDGVLREDTGRKRNRIFAADGVLEIINRR